MTREGSPLRAARHAETSLARPRRLMRQPASLPSCHTPGRTGPGPLAGAPGRLPRVSGCWCPFVVRTHSTVHPEGDKPMPHTIRKNARAWQRLWRGGEIITEIDGDDRGCPSRSHGSHRIRSTASSTARRVRLHFPSSGVSLPAACRYPPGHQGELTQASSTRSGTRCARATSRAVPNSQPASTGSRRSKRERGAG